MASTGEHHSKAAAEQLTARQLIDLVAAPKNDAERLALAQVLLLEAIVSSMLGNLSRGAEAPTNVIVAEAR